MSWWTDTAQVVGALGSAGAAVFAWRAVAAARDAAQQARDAAEEQLRPELHGVVLAVRSGPDSHPFPYQGAVMIQMRIENAGGGLAKHAAFALATGLYMCAGPIGEGFLRPGEGRRIVTTISIPAAKQDDFAFSLCCTDRRGTSRYWASDRREGIITTDGAGNYSLPALWKTLYPGRPWQDVLSRHTTEPLESEARG